ncbi:hypothetical protein [Streptomyces sp. NPDC051567]|uniref:hypothetical protein n=1 Tax=Streptomyces sp. NPDC051567 TaxID=3365660 RepID=UPI0037A7BEDA
MTSTVRTDDLRVEPVDGVIRRVQAALRLRLDPGTLVRKRRTVGARSDRGTWVRIERRRLDRIGQGWNGAEAAALLTGISRPEWHECVVWREGVRGEVMWRADETALLPAPPIGTSVLTEDPKLPDEWWRELNASMNALAAQHTSRIATPDTVTITQRGVTEAIRRAFPADFDTTVSQWVSAHADLNWANMTGPEFSLFDWEDWGAAPRGLDAASLWGNSLAVPGLAERVRSERHADLRSRDGKLMTLFVCAKILAPDAHPEDPRLAPARETAHQIVGDLQES